MLAQCEAAGVFAATKTQEVRGRLPWGRLPWGRLNREFLGGGGVQLISAHASRSLIQTRQRSKLVAHGCFLRFLAQRLSVARPPALEYPVGTLLYGEKGY